MKNRYTNTDDIEIYIDPDFEKEIKGDIKQEKSAMLDKVKEFKGAGFLKPDQDIVFSVIDRKFKSIEKQVDHYCSHEYREGLINDEVKNVERLAISFNKEREGLLQELKILQREQIQYNPKYDFSKLMWVIFFLVILYCGEIFLISQAIYYIVQESFIVTGLSSLSIGLGLFICNHLVAKNLQYILKKKVLRYGIPILYFSMFLGISILRAAAVQESAISWVTATFILISMLLTISSIYLSATKMPSDQDRINNRKFKEYNSKIQEVELKVQEINEEEALQPQKSRHKILRHIAVMAFAKNLKELIQAEREATKIEFISNVKLYIK